MQLTIRWDDQDNPVDLDHLRVSTAKVIKAHTGMGLFGWNQALRDGDPDALQALKWVMDVQNGRAGDINSDFDAVGFYEAFGEAAMRMVTAAAAGEADEAGEAEAERDPTTAPTGA